MTNSFWISGKRRRNRRRKKKYDRTTQSTYQPNRNIHSHTQWATDRGNEMKRERTHILQMNQMYKKITFSNILEINTSKAHAHMSTRICARIQAPYTVDPYVHRFLHVKVGTRKTERRTSSTNTHKLAHAYNHTNIDMKN